MEYDFLVENVLHRISLEKKGNIFIYSEGGKTVEADIQFVSSNAISILVKDKSFLVYIAQDRDKRYVYLNGQEFVVQEPRVSRESFQIGEEKPHEGKLIVKAPMPGKVIKVSVTEKEDVRKNQTLAIVESMKMENEIKSFVDGRVKAIFVSAGDLVDSEKPLIELELKE